MENITAATSSSLEAINRQYQAVTNNLSNASTPAYKRRKVSFEQILNNLGSDGLVTDRTVVDFSQGSLISTGNSLDVAINGKGFFVIDTPNGQMYTRVGAFRLNSERMLVDSEGQTVAGEGGPITIPPQFSPNQVTVGPDGTVSAGSAGVGKLRIVEFENPSTLVPVGDRHFRAPLDVQPAVAGDVLVQQGCQEASNVNISEEMVGLILASRLYEANLKMVASQDERMKYILQVAMG